MGAQASQQEVNENRGVERSQSASEKANDTSCPTVVRCDVCKDSPIKGDPWKCTVCQNYNMCYSCYTSSRGQHEESHVFRRIEQSNKRPYSEENTNDSHPDVDSTKRFKISPAQDVDKCDMCQMSPIQGIIWKDSDCMDQVMCTSCYKAFVQRKSKEPPVKKQCPDQKSEAANETIKGEDNKQGNPKAGDLPSACSCHICGVCPIQGVACKCVDCVDFVMCPSCYEVHGRNHAQLHSFWKKAEPENQQIPTEQYHEAQPESDSTKQSKTSAGASKYPLKCAVCEVYPIQERAWKCNDCVDFYMCSVCNVFYCKVHAKSHSFTKIDTPVKKVDACIIS